MKRLLLLSLILTTISVYAQDEIKPIMLDNPEGWEWIYTEKHVTHNDSYPIKLSYGTFSSHPQYKVVFGDDARKPSYLAFTSNGELVRVGLPINIIYDREYMVAQDITSKLQSHVYIQDYRNNKYGFSKEDTKAQNYVKKELNLAPFNVARPKVPVGYSEIGYRYLEQLKEDHKNDFATPLKCERLSDMSFKITFGNEDIEPTHTYMIAYTSKGAYEYDLTITDMMLESVDKSELIARAEKEQSAKVYDVVEEMPQFPGGSSAMFEYLSQKVKYPDAAKANGIHGRVVCTFIVERDGSISDVKVIRSVDPSLDKEAQQVILSMPRWIPGKQNGKTIRVKYTVPVTFRM